jgi:DNA-binding beta-propeller fold protein YncE
MTTRIIPSPLPRIACFATAIAAALLAGFSTAAAQQTAKPTFCNQPATQAVVFVDVPGRPFTPLPTKDGCWIFVSLTTQGNGPPSPTGIAMIHRTSGVVSLARMIPIEGVSGGLVLTHDGRLLIGSVADGLVFLDAGRAISGKGNAVVGYLHQSKSDEKIGGPGVVYVNVTSDDSLLFESDELAQRITVIDLWKARKSGFDASSIIGSIPSGDHPIALVFSHDERFLYATASKGAKEWGWPADCKPEGIDSSTVKAEDPQGALLVVDVERARTDPAHSVVSKVPAGCTAVRLAMSPKGDVIYVTARNENNLLAFDAHRLLREPDQALIGKVPVGQSPVGIAVVDEGRKVIVGNSNRFGAGRDNKQTLTVIDASKFRAGAGAVLGVIPAACFPRELRVTSDGRTLLVANFNSSAVELVDLPRLHPQSSSPQSEPCIK